MRIDTFHDPVLSCAQSALHRSLVRRGTAGTEALSSRHPAMRALVSHATRRTHPAGSTLGRVAAGVEAVAKEVLVEAERLVGRATGEITGTLEECARLYVEYCYASWKGEHDPAERKRAQELYDELRFSPCDPYWAEAVVDYETFRLSHRSIPYIPLAPGEGIVDLGADDVTLALVADWGTGIATAQQVIAHAVSQRVSAVVHLGDVYYAGTPTEYLTNFLAGVAAALRETGQQAVPVFNLPGNHDYYSGGVGFFDTLKVIGQQASYFCLRTPGWQIVGLDTGLNDRDPFTVESNITFLPDDQVAWLQNVMETAGGRRTILLSHHQLNSAALAVGESKQGGQTVKWGVNPRLYEQVKPYFGQIDVWLWGHEHNTVIFAPTPAPDGSLALPQGRCIGSGAVPVLVSQNPYTPAAGLVAPPGVPVPAMDQRYRLGDNGTEYHHGYAVLSLRGPAATVAYWQVTQEGAASLLLEEPVPPPVSSVAEVAAV